MNNKSTNPLQSLFTKIKQIKTRNILIVFLIIIVCGLSLALVLYRNNLVKGLQSKNGETKEENKPRQNDSTDVVKDTPTPTINTEPVNTQPQATTSKNTNTLTPPTKITPVACPAGTQYKSGGYVATSGNISDCVRVCDKEIAAGYQDYYDTMYNYYQQKIVSETAACKGDCYSRGVGYGSCPDICEPAATAKYEPNLLQLTSEYQSKFSLIGCNFNDWIK